MFEQERLSEAAPISAGKVQKLQAAWEGVDVGKHTRVLSQQPDHKVGTSDISRCRWRVCLCFVVPAGWL